MVDTEGDVEIAAKNETDLPQLCLYASIIELSRSIILRPILLFNNAYSRVVLCWTLSLTYISHVIFILMSWQFEAFCYYYRLQVRAMTVLAYLQKQKPAELEVIHNLVRFLVMTSNAAFNLYLHSFSFIPK